MASDDRYSHRSPGGTWNPPRESKGNMKMPAMLVFHFDGRQVHHIAALPPRLRSFQTCSMYYCNGVFWVVPCDATENHVAGGDGMDDESESRSDEDHQEDDWRHLCFKQINGRFTSHMSYAGHRKPSARLIAQRQDQVWANQLLPDGLQLRRVLYTQNMNKGGLVGELTVLIGLMVSSLPPNQFAELLPYMMYWTPNQPGHFRVHPPEHVARMAGCKFYRSLAG